MTILAALLVLVLSVALLVGNILRTSRKARVGVVSAVLGALCLLLATRDASAIPAFARRYEASCQTCHIAAPKLNPFGEAFLRNGFRFPAGGDATSEKEEPLSLGNDAQQDLWPGSAVYPGQLPGGVPLSLALDMKVAFGKHFESATHGSHGAESAASATHTDGHTEAAAEEAENSLRFDELGGQARLLSGGVLGNVASFFAAISFSRDGVEVERGAVTLTPLGPTVLHFKVGKFEPALHGVSIHRGFLGHQLRLTTTPVLLNGFVPEHALTGAQASGVVFGRLGWYAGAVENTAPVDGIEKDVYGRLECKVGGMRLDGVDQQPGSRAWRERSLLLGYSVYRGRGTVTYPMAGMPPDEPMDDSHVDRFTRFGVDAHVVFDDLLLDLVAVRQKHEAPADLVDDPRTMDLALAELTVMTLPWLFPTARFEASRLLGGPESHDPNWIGILSLNTLVRPNLIVRAETGVGADAGEHTDYRYSALSLLTAL